MKIITNLALAAAASIVLSTTAAAVTITPVSATGSSSFVGFGDFNAIDANPLSDWASASEGTASALQLDLGAVYVLSSAAVTDRVTSGGSNGGFVGGLSDFTTQYSITGFTDASFTTMIGAPIIVNVALPGSNPVSPAGFLSIANLGGLTARYVRYNVLATQGVNPGLSNISFEGSASGVVPEPASWALLLAGFAMVGVAARRRRVHAA